MGDVKAKLLVEPVFLQAEKAETNLYTLGNVKAEAVAKRWLTLQEWKCKTPLKTLNLLKADIPMDTLADTLGEHETQTTSPILRYVEAETAIDTLADTL